MSTGFERSLLLLVAIVTAGAGRPQTLPAGTPVKLAFAQSLSSDHAVQGERVELRVVEDVMSGETVVIRAGSRVLGTVIVGKKKEKYGFGPGLAITLDYIATPERRIPLTGREEWNRKGNASGDAVSGVFFGVGGYLMSRGRRVARVEEGTIVTAFTGEDAPLVVAPSTEDRTPGPESLAYREGVALRTSLEERPRAQASEVPRVAGTGFSIAIPAGPGWTTKRSGMGFTFERKREGPAPCKTTYAYVLAERNLPKGDASLLSEQEVAEDFRDTEEAGMMVKGVIEGMYDLTDVQRGVTTRGEKTLYFMKYRTVGPPMRRKSDSRSVSDAVLYLYFPPEFANDRFFYVFLEDASCVTKKGDGPPQRTDDILPIIDSLHIESSLR